MACARPISRASRRLRSISGSSRRVGAVVLDQIEGIQHRVMPPAAQRTKVRHAVGAGDHGLAVDQERLRLDALRSVDDGREAGGPIIAVAGEAAEARAIAAQHQPVAVMLDFVNPERGRTEDAPRSTAGMVR